MADINVNSSYGYDVIAEKMELLTGDIDYMLNNGEISKEAAEYFLKQYQSIAKICVDGKTLYNEENKETTQQRSVRF